jgi:hypothetical protein
VIKRFWMIIILETIHILTKLELGLPRDFARANPRLLNRGGAAPKGLLEENPEGALALPYSTV